jgi:hypothetical protein
VHGAVDEEGQHIVRVEGGGLQRGGSAGGCAGICGGGRSRRGGTPRCRRKCASTLPLPKLQLLLLLLKLLLVLEE